MCVLYCFNILLSFYTVSEIFLFEQKDDFVVAIKVIAKKNISKTQNLLAKEIKILKVSSKYLQLLFNKKWILRSLAKLTYCTIYEMYCMMTTIFSGERKYTKNK